MPLKARSFGWPMPRGRSGGSVSAAVGRDRRRAVGRGPAVVDRHRRRTGIERSRRSAAVVLAEGLLGGGEDELVGANEAVEHVAEGRGGIAVGVRLARPARQRAGLAESRDAVERRLAGDRVAAWRSLLRVGRAHGARGRGEIAVGAARADFAGLTKKPVGPCWTIVCATQIPCAQVTPAASLAQSYAEVHAPAGAMFPTKTFAQVATRLVRAANVTVSLEYVVCA